MSPQAERGSAREACWGVPSLESTSTVTINFTDSQKNTSLKSQTCNVDLARSWGIGREDGVIDKGREKDEQVIQWSQCREACTCTLYIYTPTPRTIIPHPPQCTSASRISSKLANITSLKFENPKIAVLRLRYLTCNVWSSPLYRWFYPFSGWRTMIWTNWEICSCLLTTIYSSGSKT